MKIKSRGAPDFAHTHTQAKAAEDNADLAPEDKDCSRVPVMITAGPNTALTVLITMLASAAS